MSTLTYRGESCLSLRKGNNYEVVSRVGGSLVRVLDETGQDYVFSLSSFEPTNLSDSIKLEQMPSILEDSAGNNDDDDDFITVIELLNKQEPEYFDSALFEVAAALEHPQKKIPVTEDIPLPNMEGFSVKAGTNIRCTHIIAGSTTGVNVKKYIKLSKEYKDITGIETKEEDWTKCVGQATVYNPESKEHYKIQLHWFEHKGEIIDAKFKFFLD